MNHKVGEFEESVLLSIHRLGDDAYGIPIRQRLEAAGRKTSVGALYITLERLEEKGMITSRQGEATAERGGRAKTFYRLTGAALSALSGVEAVRSRVRGGVPVVALVGGVG